MLLSVHGQPARDGLCDLQRSFLLRTQVRWQHQPCPGSHMQAAPGQLPPLLRSFPKVLGEAGLGGEGTGCPKRRCSRQAANRAGAHTSPAAPTLWVLWNFPPVPGDTVFFPSQSRPSHPSGFGELQPDPERDFRPGRQAGSATPCLHPTAEARVSVGWGQPPRLNEPGCPTKLGSGTRPGCGAEDLRVTGPGLATAPGGRQAWEGSPCSARLH